MKPDVAQYVIRHYSRLMTKDEKFLNKRLQAALKTAHGRSDVAAREEAAPKRALPSLQTHTPEILELSNGGFDGFAERTAERILADHKELVVVNYCPRCHELARTPKARQCRFCGHDWHTTEKLPTTE